MKKTKKTTPVKPFTEEAKAFFQEQNDQVEFMTEPTNGNYIDYLLGDIGYNPHEGTTMDTEFEDLDDSSDWFMD
jgi:hypothetical protein